MNRFFKAIFAVALITVFTIDPAQAQSPVINQPVSGQGSWETTLQARDIGNTGTTNAFYDTTLNVTWLRDTNINGAMDWNAANAWANTLSLAGINDWRLPTMANPDANCVDNSNICSGGNIPPSSSELAHLFFITLGNRSNYDSNGAYVGGGGLTNTGDFQNIHLTAYWFGNEYKPLNNPGNLAWAFLSGAQSQGYYPQSFSNSMYSIAVHDGDVGSVVSSVPEPETYAMLLAGLALIGAIGRRRSRTAAFSVA